MSSSDRDVPMSVRAAREGDGYWKSKGEQWQLLCPHMSSTAKIALGVLCSLTGQTHPVRKLTAAELAGLLSKGPVAPGETPKSMSTGGAIRVLRELADLGQITRPDGDRLTISSRPTAELSICVWKRPRHDCGCARNVHDALYELRGEELWFPSAGAGENSDQTPKRGENSDQSGENSDQSGQNSAKTSGLTCDDEAPLSSPLPIPSLSGRPSITPDTSASADAVTEEREKLATPENTTTQQVPEVPEQRAGTDEQDAIDIDAMTAALPGIGYTDAVDLGPLVAAATTAGWTTAGLYEYLAARCDTSRVAYPPAVYRKHLKALPAPQEATPAPTAPKISRATLIATCTACDAYGQYETTEGRVGMCRHSDVDPTTLTAA